jgi:hypothetical protein
VAVLETAVALVALSWIAESVLLNTLPDLALARLAGWIVNE